MSQCLSSLWRGCNRRNHILSNLGKPTSGFSSCQDQARSGRPIHVGEDDIDQIIGSNPNPTVQELATFNGRETAG
ncbi:hypothetical protein TNCV_3351091 [Trichonephila clavipes]|nr:hypothetical protein TNCV_3351091 [Trichonephila clavipes]